MNLVNAQDRGARGAERFSLLQKAFDSSAALWDGARVGIYLCDGEGRLVRFNPRAAELWGRAPNPAEEVHYCGAYRLYHADGRRVLDSEMPMIGVLRSGKPLHGGTFVVERPDGTRVDVLSSINPVLGDDGGAVGAVTCFEDITELKRLADELARRKHELEDALSERDRRIAATFEHAEVGIAEVDADGNFMRVNEALCTITGFPRRELMTHRLFDHTHAEDAARDRLNYYQQVSGGYDRYTIEKRFVRKDGRTIWLSVISSTVRDGAGNFLYSVRVVQDVTERKGAEARNKALLDELNHRVKNTLATVQTLASHTLRDAGIDETVRRALEGRLHALARTHEQLTRDHWESADLDTIVREIFEPFRTGSSHLRIEGCPLRLQPQAAVTIGLVLHELATNAAKYGSMSLPGGALDIAWRIEGKRLLRIDWRETGGPEVSSPTRRGFGSRLLDWGIAQELKGDVAQRFEPAGFSCRMDIPLASIGA